MNFRNQISMLVLCGAAAALAASTALAAPGARYLGQRLLDLAQSDPKVSPGPTDLAKELKECRFTRDDETDQTKSEKCVIRNLAPTYKQRPREELQIVADTPRCCLGAVTISPNQLTYDNTLDLFKGIPGVKKTSVACENLKAETGSREFFIISKDGQNKFTIQEETDGGSGGNQTSTTIYYGKPDLDCKHIEALDNLKWQRIREANLKRNNAQAASNNSPSANGIANEPTEKPSRQDAGREKKPLIGEFACTYTSMIATATGAAVQMKGKDSYIFRLQGASGTVTNPKNKTEEIRLVSVTAGTAAVGHLYEPIMPGELPFEWQINVESKGTLGGLMTLKKSPMGEIMAFGACRKIR